MHVNEINVWKYVSSKEIMFKSCLENGKLQQEIGDRKKNKLTGN